MKHNQVDNKEVQRVVDVAQVFGNLAFDEATFAVVHAQGDEG